jgi:hypothetical protein
MGLLSANIAVCEAVIWEQKSNVPTLVRVMTVISMEEGAEDARFYAITSLNSFPGDMETHSVFITVTDRGGNLVASTTPFEFKYGYELDPNGPGGFIMTTNVILELAKLPTALPCYLLVSAFLDKINDSVSSTPLLLRRV